MMRWIRGRPRPSLDLAGPEPDTGHAGIEGTRGVIDQQPLSRPAIGQDHRIRQSQTSIVDPDQVGGAEAVVAVHHAVNALADDLMVVLKSKLGRRTIRSFFTVDVASNGYRLWESQMRAPTDSGTALPRHFIATSTGGVTVDLMRYADEEETHVRAYEWCAELREEASSALPGRGHLRHGVLL